MELFSVIGAALIAMLLAVTLRELRKEYAVILSLCCGALLLIWAVHAAVPVVAQLQNLLKAAQMNGQEGEILLKALGISFLTQLAADACRTQKKRRLPQRSSFAGESASLSSACRFSPG
jgi:stage III sporulation protein AD